MSSASRSASQPSSLRRVWKIIRPRHGRGALSVLLASLSLACAIGLIASSAWLISRAWEQPPILALGVAVVSVRALGLGRGVFRYSERLVSHGAALRGLTEIRAQLVDRIAVVAPGGTSRLRHGDALRRFVDDVDTSSEFGLRTILPGSSAVVVGAGVVALVSLLLPLAGLAMLIGLLMGGVLAPLVTGLVSRRAAGREVHLKGDLSAELTALFAASEEIIAARATHRGVSQVRSLDRQIRQAERITARGMGLAAGIGAAAQGFALIAVILVAVPAVVAGELNGVNLAVVVLIPLVAFELVTTMPAAAIWLAKSRTSASRIVEVLDAPNAVPDPENPRDLPDDSPAHPWLSVRSGSVTWPGEAHPAIAGVNLELTLGKRIAIIGPSGVGKSSLAAGLVKFAPISGEISLCGINYDELTGDRVREVIGYSAQHSHIFDNTIAENVRLARRDASDEDIEQALERVRLGAWVASLPDGINTRVGQFGAQLSGGQRQRLALARMILADHAIAIFDEPTEHLDALTAAELATDILTVMADRSVIYITHLPHGLDLVDEVIELGHDGDATYASERTSVGS